MPEANSSSRCSVCTTYRENVLRSALNRLLKQSDENSVTVINSPVNFRSLTTPEKMGHLSAKFKQIGALQKKQIQDLRNKLSKATTCCGVKVGEEVHKDLIDLHKEQHSTHNENFASIFLNQQLKAATLKDTRQMRWHPAMIHRVFIYITDPVGHILLYTILV